MNINHCIMLKHHGFLKAAYVASRRILLSSLKFDELSTLKRSISLYRTTFLEFLKNELILYKEQGIYYFKRFNEGISIFGNISQPKEKVVHVHILNTITKFEKQH